MGLNNHRTDHSPRRYWEEGQPKTKLCKSKNLPWWETRRRGCGVRGPAGNCWKHLVATQILANYLGWKEEDRNKERKKKGKKKNLDQMPWTGRTQKWWIQKRRRLEPTRTTSLKTYSRWLANSSMKGSPLRPSKRYSHPTFNLPTPFSSIYLLFLFL